MSKVISSILPLVLIAAGMASSQAGTPIDKYIYTLAEQQLAGMHYLKPREPHPGLLGSLAPLLFLEDSLESALDAYPDRPGTPASEDPRKVKDEPTVYASTSALTVNDRSLPQITYSWFYQPKRKQGSALNGLSWQGLRITLDKSGRPVIWEVLNHTQNKQVLFVTRSLENKAVENFGKPEMGRRYSIETSLPTAPNAVVARVIDDGPVPMGPAVYLAESTRDVTSIICRCMPPQATKVISTSTYGLSSEAPPARFPPGLRAPLPLVKVLKLLPD